jgi:putative ABC transport system permease protein
MLKMLLAGMLAANRLRLALTVACVALGVALGGAVHSIHSSALAEIDRAAHVLSGTADVEIRGPRSGFDERVFLEVARHPEVLAASPIVDVDAALADGTSRVRVLGIDPLRAVRLQPALIAAEGRSGMADATRLMDLRHVWLSPTAASRLRLREGGTLRLVAGSSTLELSVAGVLPRMDAVGDLAVIDIAAAQAAFGRLGLVSRIDVRLRPGVDAVRARAELAAVLPAGVLATEPASSGPRAAAISRAYRVNLDALALIALATGAFLAFSTLALHAARRRQELALLRALGLTRRGLLVLLALEGAILGAAGSAVGTALGIVAARTLLRRLGPDLGAGYFSEATRFEPDRLALGAIAALGVAMCVAAAWWIARSLQRMDVAEGLRDRSADLPRSSTAALPLAIVLALAGIPLLMLPPVAELPLGGYGAIAAWLLASVLAVGPISRALLRLGAGAHNPLAFLAIGGNETTVRVAGVIRDYARTWGAVMMPLADYRRLTGETRAHDLALHLARGVDSRAAQAAIRHALPQAQGLVFEDARELRERSLEIFDRSFAVTYALEAAAIAIGLAGVTSSFAALAWSRRREFGVLRFLGLRRGEVLRLLVIEGLATGALGALIGLVSGIAISVVLVHVVNRQSFHWTLEMHWPVATLAALLGAIVVLCAFGARASGALAVRDEAIAAVKDDA